MVNVGIRSVKRIFSSTKLINLVISPLVPAYIFVMIKVCSGVQTTSIKGF
jgi:hypothetical protein